VGEKNRILLWCAGAPNQRALANKIADRFDLCGIVIDEKRNTKNPPFIKRAIAALHDRIFFRPINGAWTYLQKKYAASYPGWPDVPIIRVASINSEEAYNFTKELSPYIIAVSGTALVRPKMLSLSSRIINLHTGLSPYIKGGPNCTNWCISTGQYEKIGNTIMWINEGIDSGNIITTECTILNGVKSLNDIQFQVMEHAHDLYIRAIDYLLNTPAPHNSVPQKQITPGKLYLSRMWNFSAKKKLLKNLPALIKKGIVAGDQNVVTIGLKHVNSA